VDADPSGADAAPRYELGSLVTRGFHVRAYVAAPHDPPVRPLRVYTLDPTFRRGPLGERTLQVPYEPVAPTDDGFGFGGAVLEIDARDDMGVPQRVLDLDATDVLLGAGVAPTSADPRFHQQMVYAVAMSLYATFQRALGRDVAWGSRRGRAEDGALRLRIRPYGAREMNAWYDGEAGEIVFGWQPSEGAGPTAPPQGIHVYTALSHGVVVHETTHALVDGLRSHFRAATNPDVRAFHEAFADLMAHFSRLDHEALVRTAFSEAGSIQGGDAGDGFGAPGPATGWEAPALLRQLAREVGASHGRTGGLRDALESDARYSPDGGPTEPHERGQILVAAVFEAYWTVFLRRTRPLVRIATGGQGRLPEGSLQPALASQLAREAGKLAGHFLAIMIRALDYCPPVDIRFGEFLRAMITADRDLVPSDPYGYRESLVESFRRRGIVPPGVNHLSEDALLWNGPSFQVEPCERLAFSSLEFDGDPATPESEDELRRQANELGRLATTPGLERHFGLRPAGDGVGVPVVQSIRMSRRVSPDGRVRFDLIGELTQTVWHEIDDGSLAPTMGGSTVILGPHGEVRYVVHKRLPTREEDIRRWLAFVQGPDAEQEWTRSADQDGRVRLRPTTVHRCRPR
jgi:hypothetical protein